MTYDSREASQYGGQPVECYKFQRGASTFLFTSADKTVVITPGTFAPEVIGRGPINQTQESQMGSVEVTLPRDHPFVAQFVPYLPTDLITLIIYSAHRGDSDVIVIFNGEVASSRFSDSECILNCTPLTYRLSKRCPSTTFQSKCNHALYSPLCTVDKNLFKLEGIVSTVAADTITAAIFATKPDQWLRNGWIERADGDKRFIINHQGSVIVVDAPFTTLAAGESIKAYAGCERTEADCTSKFNNLVNHLGFARMPLRNPFDGITDWQSGTATGTPSPPLFRRG